ISGSSERLSGTRQSSALELEYMRELIMQGLPYLFLTGCCPDPFALSPVNGSFAMHVLPGMVLLGTPAGRKGRVAADGHRGQHRFGAFAAVLRSDAACRPPSRYNGEQNDRS